MIKRERYKHQLRNKKGNIEIILEQPKLKQWWMVFRDGRDRVMLRSWVCVGGSPRILFVLRQFGTIQFVYEGAYSRVCVCVMWNKVKVKWYEL